jgi:hypothetical protein
MPDKIRGERNNVVAHFKNGRLIKGYTHDFTTARDSFHLTSEREEDRGKVHNIKISDLKAVFFVKMYEGNREYIGKKRFEEVDASKLRGLRIKVEFNDGEVIRGISLGYNKRKKGFFMVEVDPKSNNQRIYIVADALRDVKVGSAAEE